MKKANSKFNTKVNLCGIELDFPLYNGSGSFEYGDYQWTKLDFKNIPVLVLKTSTLKSKITPEKRENLLFENETQIFNSIGLQNPDIKGVVQKIKEFNKKFSIPLIASASGDSVKEFAKNVEILSQQNVVAIEINLSCPNVEKGGITYGTDPKLVYEVVKSIKKVAQKPIFVKLTPNITDIVAIGLAAQKAGADAIIAINTLLGFVCEPLTGKPVISRGYGGYSGAGIFPIALRMVHQLYKVLKIPIIGVGGISKTQDFIDMLSVGASAVQIVSATKNNFNIFKQIKTETISFMQKNKINDIKKIIGRSHKYKLKNLFPGSYTNPKSKEMDVK